MSDHRLLYPFPRRKPGKRPKKTSAIILDPMALKIEHSTAAKSSIQFRFFAVVRFDSQRLGELTQPLLQREELVIGVLLFVPLLFEEKGLGDELAEVCAR